MTFNRNLEKNDDGYAVEKRFWARKVRPICISPFERRRVLYHVNMQSLNVIHYDPIYRQWLRKYCMIVGFIFYSIK